MELARKIEAVLFARAEPVSARRLSELLEVPENEIKDALFELEKNLEGRGLQIVWQGTEIMMGTRAEFGPLLEKIRKEELNKDLTRAALETLSLILYRPGATRAEIDWVRGVNSSFILRGLAARGLVERKTHPTDQRRYIYEPSFDLLSYLGLSKVEDLPQFEEVKKILSEK